MSKKSKFLPTIVIPDHSCGPAMKALTEPQRAFVHYRVWWGLGPSNAAKRAGYATNGGQAGHGLANNPKVIAAIEEERPRWMKDEGLRSIHTLIQIRDDKRHDAKERRAAAVAIADRVGFGPSSTQNIDVKHTHTLSNSELDQRMIELALEAGLPEAEARKLLVVPANVIEGEFTVKEPEKVLTPEEEAARAKHAEEQRRYTHRKKLPPEEHEAEVAKVYEAQRQKMKAKRAAAEAARASQQLNIEDAIRLVDAVTSNPDLADLI